MPRLTRRAALALPVVAAVPASEGISTMEIPSANPDAELIAKADAYIAAVEFYNRRDRPFADCDDDPYWDIYLAARTALDECDDPTTLAGIAALCRAAQADARQDDGRLDYRSNFTGDRPGQIIVALLRIAGSA